MRTSWAKFSPLKACIPTCWSKACRKLDWNISISWNVSLWYVHGNNNFGRLLISNILAKKIGPNQSKLNLIKNNNLLGLNVESDYGKGATFQFIIEDKNESDLILFTSNRHCNLNPHNFDVKFMIDKKKTEIYSDVGHTL